MALIRIEWLPIKVNNLGLLGLDHLQLVYDPQAQGGNPQDNWYVLEGLKSTPYLGVEGTDGFTTLSDANNRLTGAALHAYIGSPDSRGTRILPLEARTSWFTMSSYAAQIDGEFTYSVLGIPGTVRPTCNSSSVIASLLYAVGLDATQYLPFGLRLSPGTNTLLGTHGADEMTATEAFPTLFGGRGDDKLTGSKSNDKLYGGIGNDVLVYSRGLDMLHGGQWGMSYAGDGIDAVDYSGVGRIEIRRGFAPVHNASPDFIVTTSAGIGHLFSIERLRWNTSSDEVVLKGDVQMLENGMFLQMSDESDGQGDRIDFSAIQQAIYIAPTTDSEQLFVRALAGETGEGSWLESAEWLVGSLGADEIYLPTGVRGVEGGEGDDVIDASRIAAFSGFSPEGYDIEIDGGAGSDTLVATAGRTLLRGGGGADRFVLSATTGEAGTVEMIIEDAEASDRLLLPYNFFNGSDGPFQGSDLMPVLGGFGVIEETGPDVFARFEALHQDHYWFGEDDTQGVIKFVGEIDFNLEGNDLVIHVYRGEATEEIVEVDDTGATKLHVFNDSLPSTETLIRVKNYTRGMLGIDFYELDHGTIIDLGDGRSAVSHGNFDSSVDAMTNGGVLYGPLDLAPETASAWAPAQQAPADIVDGSSGADVINVSSATQDTNVAAGGGDDHVVTGSGADSLDGGTGDDVLEGGLGDDTYYIDSLADIVVEADAAGDDRVYSSVDAVLPDHVEMLYLSGEAISAVGNAAANTLVGNELDNALFGDAGDDVLLGAAGNDELVGGSGSDTYLYSLGDGYDVVADGGEAGDIDRIVFNADITAADVEVWRLDGRPDDLLLLLPYGGRIVIQDYALDTGAIERIEFADDPAWTLADLLALADAAPLRGNEAPLAADDLEYIVQTPSLTIDAAALTANDFDFEDDALRIIGVESVAVALVSLDADGNVAFSVPDEYEGLASFRYTVTDDHGGTTSALVEISVMRLEAVEPPPPEVGTAGRDRLTGSAADDALDGLAGNDVLVGLGGDDTLKGGRGRDILEGGEGDDILDGATGETAPQRDTLSGGLGDDIYLAYGDTILERAGEGYDTVYAFASLRLAAGQEVEAVIAADAGARTIIGNELAQTLLLADGARASLYGAGGDDTLAGNGGDNRLFGGDGDDVVTGGGGRDWINGGAGNDLLYGEDADGTLQSAQPTGRDDVLLGGSGDDELYGGAGDDLLYGGAGADVLAGGAGDDTLRGNAGADRFVFAGSFGHDSLRDFRAGDLIELSGFGIGYDDLVFTRVRGGISITCADFDDGSSILVAGVKTPIQEASFRFT